jgi:hypothetical protein
LTVWVIFNPMAREHRRVATLAKSAIVAIAVLVVVACPLPYQFTPADGTGNVVASNDPANPSVTAAPQLRIVEKTDGSETSDTTPAVDVDLYLESETPGATIFYRTDGARPIPGADGTSIYSSGSSIPVHGHGRAVDIRAVAIGPSMYPSTVTAQSIAVNYVAAPAPTFSPAPGDYATGQSITISSAIAGAEIYYTLEASEAAAPAPVPGAAGTELYTGPITVSGVGSAVSIAAVVVADQRLVSAIAAGTWTIGYDAAPVPQITATPGLFVSSVSIAVDPAGAQIFYTIDGSDPTDTGNPSRTEYTDPFTLYDTRTVRAYADGAGYTPSAEATSTVTLAGLAGAYDSFDDGVVDTGRWTAWHQLGGRSVEAATFQLADSTGVDTSGTMNVYGHGQNPGWTGVGHLRSVAAGTEWSFTITNEYMGRTAGGTQGWGVFARDPYDGSRVKLVATYNDINIYQGQNTPTNANYVAGGDGVGQYIVRRTGSQIEVHKDGQLIRTLDGSSIQSVFQLYVTANNAFGVDVSYAAVAIDQVSVVR